MCRLLWNVNEYNLFDIDYNKGMYKDTYIFKWLFNIIAVNILHLLLSIEIYFMLVKTADIKHVVMMLRFNKISSERREEKRDV